LNRKPAPEPISRSSFDFLHFGHFRSAGSLIDWKVSSSWPQAAQR